MGQVSNLNGIEAKIFQAIDSERKDRRIEIAEIHKRIDRLPDEIIKRLPKMDPDASWVRQSVGLGIAVVTIIGFTLTIFNSITSPMQLQIDYMRVDLKELKQELGEHRNKPAHFSSYGTTTRIEEQIERIQKELDRQYDKDPVR